MKTIGYLLGVSLALCPLTLKANTWTDADGVNWEYYLGWDTYGNATAVLSALKTYTLKSVTLPSVIGSYRVTSISADAFSGRTELESIIIPEGITSIGTGAFKGCTGLKSISFPSGLTTISENTCSGCTSLKEITFPATVTTIGQSAFESCKSLVSLSIPGTVSRIESYAFSACKSLTSLTLEEGVRVIDGRAFQDSPLVEVVFPSTLSSFGDGWNDSILRLYFKGKPVKPVCSTNGSVNMLYYPQEYAAQWETSLAADSSCTATCRCMEDRLGVVTLQHGGTTSIKEKVCAWGEEVSVTAAAKEGYVFLGWDSDREGIEGTEETITFTMPQAPVTLVANFFPKALLEGWMDTRIDAKVDGERLMTADQAAEKTAAAIEGKVESGELFTPAGAEAKAAEEIAQKVANKELITADSLQEMALDAPVIEVDASGTAKVGISLQKARSLSGDWEEVALAEDAASVSAGALKLAVPAEEGTAFYKFVVPARQGAQEP